jgi:hypothetical protein
VNGAARHRRAFRPPIARAIGHIDADRAARANWSRAVDIHLKSKERGGSLATPPLGACATRCQKPARAQLSPPVLLRGSVAAAVML